MFTFQKINNGIKMKQNNDINFKMIYGDSLDFYWSVFAKNQNYVSFTKENLLYSLFINFFDECCKISIKNNDDRYENGILTFYSDDLKFSEKIEIYLKDNDIVLKFEKENMEFIDVVIRFSTDGGWLSEYIFEISKLYQKLLKVPDFSINHSLIRKKDEKYVY